jgi:hypothetical protein
MPQNPGASTLPQTNQYASYPSTLKDIGYASYMRITRFTYQEGLAKAGKNQKDALRIAGGNSDIVRLTRAFANTASNFYNGVTTPPPQRPQGNVPTNPFNSWFSPYYNVNPFGGAAGAPLTPTPNTVHPANNANIEKARARKRQTLQEAKGAVKQYVQLAMPNEFQYEYGANWNNTFKLGTLALLADDPGAALGVGIAAGAAGAALAAYLTRAKVGAQSANAAQNAGQAFTGAFGSVLNPFGVNSPINPTNLVGLAGLAPNENAIQFFKNMDFRSFTFNFELAARNADESKIIKDIIKFFKEAMHPRSFQGGVSLGYGGTGGLLGFPDVFVLEPMFNQVDKSNKVKAVDHPMMPKTKLCALTNLKINTTPFNSLVTVFDGNIPMITMSLTFTELTALTSADFEIGYGNEGGF